MSTTRDFGTLLMTTHRGRRLGLPRFSRRELFSRREPSFAQWKRSKLCQKQENSRLESHWTVFFGRGGGTTKQTHRSALSSPSLADTQKLKDINWQNSEYFGIRNKGGTRFVRAQGPPEQSGDGTVYTLSATFLDICSWDQDSQTLSHVVVMGW